MSKMLKSISILSRKFCKPQKAYVEGRRWFLSQAYRCQDAWEKRLESPILQQVKLDDFHYEVDTKYQNEQKISAIDVDLFANAVPSEDYLDELEDLVHKLRLSPNTVDMLPSTSHALIRLFLAAGRSDELLRILNDRLNYGIFPDYYTACLLMDTFLKQHDYTAAAQVGALQMLQEDWDDVLTTYLSVYACHMHLRQPGVWKPEEVPEPPDDGEEIKVRVKYIRNPYFDDHFDLRDPKHLVGKTLAAAGARFPGAVGRTYQLVGWAMYEKWKRALAVLEQLTASQENPLFYKEGLARLEALVEEGLQKEGADKETLERLQQQVRDVSGSGRVTEEDLHEALVNAVRQVAAEDEPRKVAEQCRTFEAWHQLREERLREELAAVQREKRSREIVSTLEDLERRERTIFFFDNQEQWELEAEEKEKELAEAAARVSQSSAKKANIEEEYIPPEVKRSRT